MVRQVRLPLLFGAFHRLRQDSWSVMEATDRKRKLFLMHLRLFLSQKTLQITSYVMWLLWCEESTSSLLITQRICDAFAVRYQWCIFIQIVQAVARRVRSTLMDILFRVRMCSAFSVPGSWDPLPIANTLCTLCLINPSFPPFLLLTPCPHILPDDEKKFATSPFLIPLSRLSSCPVSFFE